MKRTLGVRACAFGLTALLLCATATAQQTGASEEASASGVLLASCNGQCGEDYGVSIDSGFCDCDDCGDCLDGCSTGCCDTAGCGSGACQPGFFVGGEYIYARANFSEATSFVNYTFTPSITAPDAVATRTYVPYDFDYEGSFRYFAGYRLNCCGDELRFSGTSLTSNAGGTQTAGTFPFQTPFTTFDGPTFGDGIIGNGDTGVGANGPSTGSVVTLSANVDMDYWDLTFARSIPLGGAVSEPFDPCACGGCGTCNDCCGCCCPSWDIKWMGGVRVANGGWDRAGFVDNNAVGALAGGADNAAYDQFDFDGAGLLFGMEGRRYFGPCGVASVYVKGNIAALLGNASYHRESWNENGGVRVQGTTAVDQADFTRVVPVTEIEIGSKVFLTSNMSLSGGYFFQAWHDLGMGAEVQVNDAANDLRFDDANILGFDGFFVRGEATF
ncbi:hypothetical protein Mal64_29170 [Pseudobythopirellula maris]|uniref:Uncharacterized protein n=1 Tax=Pseudobythopirellula maris TaxID=2527991 RepID=A0A5C5ZJN2_9BACT|nr:hypothetical protein [Pseudobythopirellula maris]TWT87378.1 hypothetical protein Mal64_29170 [Pseudobythopirellula maris]